MMMAQMQKPEPGAGFAPSSASGDNTYGTGGIPGHVFGLQVSFSGEVTLPQVAGVGFVLNTVQFSAINKSQTEALWPRKIGL